MWMVYTKEDGIVYLSESKEEAVEVYNREKKKDVQYLNLNGESDIEFIDTILAKVESRHFFKEYQNVYSEVIHRLKEETY
ncbi:hypothetical protein [Bacillus sp. AG4(2022)]|uniref:hypothetical protein n=1 Tax=Bacillus sp. AG4(2022) TaxID=2962594 RepID=UPI0028825A98|nr:hypothetical protein [Bacillus sp. AG4(2022)]MDT0160450.1 hypothetical protein [Bacillus sp. AG4(2022)]